MRNNNLSKEILDKYYQNNNTETKNNGIYENIYITDIRLLPNHKLKFSIIKYNEQTYMIIDPQKFSRKMLQYINWGNFKFPIEIIKEKRKKINETNNME
jgi:hypothetical protein